MSQSGFNETTDTVVAHSQTDWIHLISERRIQVRFLSRLLARVSQSCFRVAFQADTRCSTTIQFHQSASEVSKFGSRKYQEVQFLFP